MGIALGGLLPCVTSIIRHSVPDKVAGHDFGYLISAQDSGQVVGPLAGGFIGGRIEMRAVFVVTCVLMAVGSVGNRAAQTRLSSCLSEKTRNAS